MRVGITNKDGVLVSLCTARGVVENGMGELIVQRTCDSDSFLFFAIRDIEKVTVTL